MSNFVHGRKVIDTLIQLGIADSSTQRVVIDIPINGVPILYIQKIGTTKVIDLIKSFDGIDIKVMDTEDVSYPRYAGTEPQER